MIPNLIERTGNSDTTNGSITAFYTVLADADDHNDPVVDTARAILDGHILLSRNNAQMGIYPAVDITNSVSRVMNEIIKQDHLEIAQKFRAHVSSYIENKDLLMMGGYVQGKDTLLDEAIALWPKIIDFIAQKENEKINYSECISKMDPKFSNVDFGKFEYESKTLSSLPSAGITANGIFFLIDTLFKSVSYTHLTLPTNA